MKYKQKNTNRKIQTEKYKQKNTNRKKYILKEIYTERNFEF
jgi:hypothetical protein